MQKAIVYQWGVPIIPESSFASKTNSVFNTTLDVFYSNFIQP
jgi:hypothetical protein